MSCVICQGHLNPGSSLKHPVCGRCTRGIRPKFLRIHALLSAQLLPRTAEDQVKVYKAALVLAQQFEFVSTGYSVTNMH